jgi:hypothetical protein
MDDRALMIEARLIEAVRVTEAMPDGRASPWAKDAPWHLMRLPRSERYAPHVDLDEARAATWQAVLRIKPDRDAIDRASEALEWLHIVSDEDRVIVCQAVRCLASGYAVVPWAKVMLDPDVLRNVRFRRAATAHSCRMRYHRAMDALANRVFGAVMGRAHEIRMAEFLGGELSRG